MDGLNKPHSRRKFLTTSGLAAVAAGSVLGKHGQAAAAPASAANPGLTATNMMELPPSAQVSIRCLRSLTMLTMSSQLTDPAFSADVYEIGLKDLESNLQELIGLGTSDLVSYRPNPEESLPTRPWWWPKRRVRHFRGQLGHETIPEAGQLVLDIIRSLDGYTVAFYSQDLAFAELSQHLALVEMQTQFQRLINAPSLAGLFPDDDDICPWWWPYETQQRHSIPMSVVWMAHTNRTCVGLGSHPTVCYDAHAPGRFHGQTATITNSRDVGTTRNADSLARTAQLRGHPTRGLVW